MSQLFSTEKNFRKLRESLDSQLSIGFVPTMGALHKGHASLVQASVAQNDLTIVSIFVNPTQFGPNEDLDAYPRTLEKDRALLDKLGVDFIFSPTAQDIYGSNPNQIQFSFRDIDRKLCGSSRDGHFNGVAQVVSILFNIVQPDRAYFGEKDYQQCLILKTLVSELHFPLEVVPCPIVRETDGLAMSSRNIYLNPEERKQALFLFRTLSYIKERREDFQTVSDVKAYVEEQISHYPLARLDYFDILNDENLQELDILSPDHHPRAFMAVFLGKTRLIDNMSLY